ncbi:hypothetical protein GJ25_gp049 [Mycobacterium phage Hawkeye]|uniref:Uncharacterized protein n=1 Tax=Mycobacterium phage Hawkeye TaxID=1458711 RepID=X2KT25_9CAUD|nr:hypothetical protein GJ25_gp049 [Mycobacterium phage Hawkeye]AHN84060.1 hypothetical protein PBI_HAWKEYE_49 [Mycobacterium phage Hawkeye]
MTKTEAADTIAMHVVIAARNGGKVISKMLVAEIMSEFSAGHRGPFLAEAANAANWKNCPVLPHGAKLSSKASFI